MDKNKYLIVVIGHNYLNPMIVLGNMDYIVSNLSNESCNNSYIYAIYIYNGKYDCYMPYGVIHNGLFSDKEGCRIDGIRISR